MSLESLQPPPSIGRAEQVVLVERAYDHPDAVELLTAFHQEQIDRYGFADPIAADPADYVPPQGLFIVAYRQGTPAGCGAYRWHDRPTFQVEIKKLYTLPTARGFSVGGMILHRIEQHAAMFGARRAILETGVRNSAAIRLFQDAGYHPIAPYVVGRDPEINRAFARSLIKQVEPRGERQAP